MATLSQAREALQKLQQEAIEIAAECMLEQKEQIVALLVDQQYNQGVDSSDKPLRTYSRRYMLLKEHAGLYTGKTDLNATGEFHGEMNLRVDAAADEFEINSASTTAQGELKSAWLRKWNKTEIMNLTPENLDRVWPIIRELFIERCNQRLGFD